MMYTHADFLRFRKTGSIILEIAITAPIFLLVSAFLLTGITCARADVLFSQAIDQVTQEIAVGVPVVGGALDIMESVLSMLNSNSSSATETGAANSEEDKPIHEFMSIIGGVSAVMDALGIEGEDISATLLLGKGIRDRIVATFYSYFPENDLLHDRIRNVSVYVDYDEPNKVVWLRVYYEWNTFLGPAERMIESAVPIYGDLELSLPVTEDSGTAADKVWSLTNFERGLSIRASFGGNLPFNYPVIACWNNGTATSIKSIDLTAPDYLSGGELTDNVTGFLNDLSNFEGTESAWGNDQIEIENEMITSKVLIIVIPENSPENIYNELMACNSFACTQGIEMRIEKFGNSYRYTDQEQEPTDNT